MVGIFLLSSHSPYQYLQNMMMRLFEYRIILSFFLIVWKLVFILCCAARRKKFMLCMILFVPGREYEICWVPSGLCCWWYVAFLLFPHSIFLHCSLNMISLFDPHFSLNMISLFDPHSFPNTLKAMFMFIMIFLTAEVFSCHSP